MTSDLEELLHEGLDRLTAGAEVPAGLLGRARLRNRQRRMAIRASVAAGTALAAAAAVIIVTSGAGHRPQGGGATQTQTVAYVTSRTQQALAAEERKGRAIEEILTSGRHVTFGFTVLNMALSKEKNPVGSAVLPGVLAGVSAERMVTWLYRQRILYEGFSAAGTQVFNSTFNVITTRSGRQVTKVYGAAYPARTRWKTDLGGQSGPLPPLTCQTVIGVAPLGSSWRAALSKAVSCGLFRLDGRQRVDGVDALKIASKPDNGLPARETIWVDPATYLPVRVAVAFRSAHAAQSLLVYDYRWLLPTKGNLAALRAAVRGAAIPPGFRKLPPNYLPLSGANP
jgi:RNase P protein component